MSTIISRSLIVLVLGLSLSACGFHLRGKINVPDSLKQIHIIGDDAGLVKQLGKSLEFSDIVLVAADQGSAVLDLSNIEYKKDVNGTDSNGIVSSYTLKYLVEYEVLDAEKNSLQKHRVSQSRTLEYDAENILLFERKETFLKDDMLKEVVAQMLRRISKIK